MFAVLQSIYTFRKWNIEAFIENYKIHWKSVSFFFAICWLSLRPFFFLLLCQCVRSVCRACWSLPVKTYSSKLHFWHILEYNIDGRCVCVLLPNRKIYLRLLLWYKLFFFRLPSNIFQMQTNEKESGKKKLLFSMILHSCVCITEWIFGAGAKKWTKIYS